MAFTADPSTNIGKVRLLVCDLDVAKPVFPDDNQILAFLDLEQDDVRCAGALALETIAGNRQLTMLVVQILDLKLDGFSVAKGLLATAKQWRDAAELSDTTGWAGFDIAEVVDNSQFAWREKYWKMLLQQSI